MSEVLAGKIGVTNGGEWNAKTYYEEATFVRHQNNLYLSNLPSTGVEPTNEEYWMLAMEGFSGEDVQTLIDSINNIIDGFTQVGNAKTLDGHGAEDFAAAVDLSNYFPKSGGTIESTESRPLKIKRTSADGNVAIQFLGASGALGYLGFISTDDPVYIPSGGSNSKTLLHTGNKPTGTYTGNGDATQRTIQTNGVGSVLYVRNVTDRADSKYSCAIVMSNGYIGKDENGNFVSGQEAFIGGNASLVVKSTSPMFNKSGATYEYQVL